MQDVLFGVGLGYQYQRLIKAVVSSTFDHPNVSGSNENKAKVSSAVKKMRAQQILFCSIGGCAAIIWLLNITRAVLPYYWYTVLHFGVEVIFTLLSAISMATKSRRPQLGVSSDPIPTSAGNSLVIHKQISEFSS